MGDQKIAVRNNGPLRIEGDNIVLTDQDDRPWDVTKGDFISHDRADRVEPFPCEQ